MQDALISTIYFIPPGSRIVEALRIAALYVGWASALVACAFPLDFDYGTEKFQSRIIVSAHAACLSSQFSSAGAVHRHFTSLASFITSSYT